MQIKGLRIPFILISAILSLALLIGAQWIYKEFAVERPLMEKIFNLSGVESAEFTDDSKPSRLDIKLNSDVELADFIARVKNIVVSDYGNPVELHLIDQRNEELNELLTTSRFYIYEALVKGNYTEMYASLNKLFESSDLEKWELTMDNQYLYLELQKESNYLYEVIPRSQETLVIIGGELADASN